MMQWNTDLIPAQTGKRILITGANSGIGFKAAEELAAKGAEILMAVRDTGKGQKARETLLAKTPAAIVELIELDLSDLESVKKCVAYLTEENKPLDILINNAGVMLLNQRTLSKQNHEVQWATNHLGHFALTCGLLPLLEKTDNPRIVTLSSLVAKFKQADIFYDDLNFSDNYDKMAAYAQSKLANAMFASELDKRLKATGSNVKSIAAHPGYTATNLQQHMGVMGTIMNLLFAQNANQGVLPTLRAATDPDLTGGEYIGPMKMGNYRGHPGLNSMPEAALKRSETKRLWSTTEEIVGLSFLPVSD